MGSIVTFYSYKGGVGRSMALANVALLLAQRGLRVLAVDFDLEAPGLERYFGYFEIRSGGPGLLRMFMQAQSGEAVDYNAFTSTIECQTKHPIVLLPSGREQDEAYSANLEAFEWDAFFSEHRGGDFVEGLRTRWREDFDIVLIDSRTGLSDTGGICTIQLPDIVVAMFTANYQSLYGVRDVMRLAQRARQGLAYDRMPLTVLPLASRWGTQEFSETQIWLDRIGEAMHEFCADWLPRPGRARDVVEQLKVPQRDYFGFGEKLAVVEQGVSDPSGMGFVYDRIATILKSDFAEIGLSFTTPGSTAPAPPEPPPRSALTAPQADYQYDIFVSHEHSSSEFALMLVEALRVELAPHLDVRIFLDLREVQPSTPDFQEQLDHAMLRSRVLLALLTPRYVTRELCMREFETFRERSHETGTSLLMPVVLRGTEFPARVIEVQWVDFRQFPRFNSRSRSAAWQGHVRHLAQGVLQMIQSAPSFDETWTVADSVPRVLNQLEPPILSA